MSRGAFHGGHARHAGDAERVEVDAEHVHEDEGALEGPGQQNSGAARQAEAARDQRRTQRQGQEERTEAPEIVDPRLRELAAALPPPPAAKQQRLYTAADGVDGEPDEGVAGAPPADDDGAGDAAWAPVAPWHPLGTPPPPPPSAPPLDDVWSLFRRDDD